MTLRGLKRRLGAGCWLALLLSCWQLPARAQHENDNWFFGSHGGLSFATGFPVALPGGALTSGEGCASVSDAQGQLQLYTNGIGVWNRQHQLLLNGGSIGGYAGVGEVAPNSATQGALIVPRPGSSTEYFVFTVDAAENGLSAGLQYALVDVARAGGQGEVLSQRNRLPAAAPAVRVTEKLAAVRHANGQDTWVLVHGWLNDEFLAFLVTAAGVTGTPVVSAVGAVHQGGANSRQDYNALGCLVFAPDGRRLALTRYHAGTELLDFDRLTGRLSNARSLPTPPECYGLAFSPSGQLLYGTAPSQVWQLELGSNQLLTLASTAGPSGAVQLGPDRRLYVASPLRSTLSLINFPDLPGIQCGFLSQVVPLPPGTTAQWGLPNAVVVPPPPAAGPQLAITAGTSCLRQAVDLRAALTPAVPGATFVWDFGDPASPDNTAVGPAVQHTFTMPTSYRVTVRATLPGGAAPVVATLLLPVLTAPVELGLPILAICPGEVLRLQPQPQPGGTRYRWHDGSLGGSYEVRQPGLYWVEASTLQGCLSRDSVRVVNLADLTLGADTLACVDAPIILRVQPMLGAMEYRWFNGTIGGSAAIRQPGSYWVEVRRPGSSCAVRLTRRVSCPALPNVITPNGDGRNDAFVLSGLPTGSWALDVFNRWGRRVYAAAAYDNSWRAEGQAAGQYYYVLRHQLSGDTRRGWVEVVR